METQGSPFQDDVANKAGNTTLSSKAIASEDAPEGSIRRRTAAPEDTMQLQKEVVQDSTGSSNDHLDDSDKDHRIVDKGKGRALELFDSTSDSQLALQQDEMLQVSTSSGSTENPLSRPSEHRPPLPPRKPTGNGAINTTQHQYLTHDIDLSEISYEMKTIEFNGEPLPIVLQTTNGPCPILSIANFLSLSSAGLTLPRLTPRISANHLTELLVEYLINNSRDLTHLSEVNALHRGLNVNPMFTGVNHFQEGKDIIQSFGGEMVHGWIPDRNDPAWQVLADYNSETSIKDFETAQVQVLTEPEAASSTCIKQFLDETPNNISSAGLQLLRAHLKEGEMSILFYNSHFSLLYKHPLSGDLYCLVTDAGYLSSGNDVVWESLTLEYEGTQVFSSDFIPRSVLGESKHEDKFGQQTDRGLKGEDADAQLARQLQEEEHGRTNNSDREIAERLQRQLNVDDASEQRRRAERDRRRREEQQRVDEYNGIHNDTQTIGQHVSHPGDHEPESAVRKPAKKDCVVM